MEICISSKWQAGDRERKAGIRMMGSPPPLLASMGKSPARCKTTKCYRPVRNKKFIKS